MAEKKLLRKLTPDDYYHTIYDIDLDKLARDGIKGIVVDLDNTLVPRKQNHTTERLQQWFEQARELGFKVCILSNNWKSRGSIVARKLSLPLIARAKKPSKSAFNKALATISTAKSETVVIGDQIFTDVLGGNRLGLYTILVVPLSGKEIITTRFVRQLEKFVLSKLKKRNIIPKSNGE